MLQGDFCFIKDEYFEKYDKRNKIPHNHEITVGEDGERRGGRPYFFVFDDRFENKIYWCIPISSQIKKYQDLREHKLSEMIVNGAVNPVCNQICFGKVLGESRAFLVQNMFPVTDKYISGFYKGKNGDPVSIDPHQASFIRRSARILLSQYNRGQKQVFFPDVDWIRRSLLFELRRENGSLQVKRGRLEQPAFIPNENKYHGPTKEEAVKPSPARKGTMDEYAASIVEARERAVKNRSEADKAIKTKGNQRQR